MNFNLEFEKVMRGLGMDVKAIPLTEEEKGTAQDWDELNSRIAWCQHKNQVTAELSLLAADRCVLG